MTPSYALYIHIPFCAVRCAYCDFNTYAGLETLYEPYTAALIAEIRRAGEAAGRPGGHTIFIGGGTPTVLPPDLLARILDACRAAFDVAPGAEITSEANPGTVDQARFAALAGLGVNRLSMGVQSFDDAELRWLGRIHTAAEAEAAFVAARAAGFDNINLDFIFGLPGQEPTTWAATLARAVSLAPEHLSLYSLTVEHGTPLADQVRRGLVTAPDDDLAADLYDLACDTLAKGGYEQYEISNWARVSGQTANGKWQTANGKWQTANGNSQTANGKWQTANGNSQTANGNSQTANDNSQIADGKEQGAKDQFAVCSLQFASDFQCRHNLVYWRREPYLGFGAGAHSFAGARRWWNVRPVPAYIQRIGKGSSPEAGSETIERRLAMGETMMLGLRLVAEGVPDDRFRERFGVGLEEAFGREIRRLVARGLLARLPDRVRLTPAARLVGNRVFAEFLPGE
ncbi:MAG: radical SAM family heme chaperone HemW [Chloroflexi bacterium]|nr:radical SAM family heme chaperone HemW [Chloroflexota bacterium]